MKLFYLAGPIESNRVLGASWREDLIKALFMAVDKSQWAVFDPSRAYHYRGDWAPMEIGRFNRKMIDACDAMLVLLGGCETWREIEYMSQFHSHKPIVGMWPTACQSTVAENGIVVKPSLTAMAEWCIGFTKNPPALGANRV